MAVNLPRHDESSRIPSGLTPPATYGVTRDTFLGQHKNRYRQKKQVRIRASADLLSEHQILFRIALTLNPQPSNPNPELCPLIPKP